jgi:hypothetical protein
MNKYAQVALKAIEIVKIKNISPEDAWTEASRQIFPESESSRKKACPKNAFLGLCEEGIIIGVKQGNYTKSKDNKRYAIEAVDILRREGDLSEKHLWERIEKADKNKRHNQQMHVVRALFNQNCIIFKI